MYSYRARLQTLNDLGLAGLKVVDARSKGKGANYKTELLQDEPIPVRNDQGFLCACDTAMPVSFAIIAEIKRTNDLLVFETSGHERKIQLLTDKTPGNAIACYVKIVSTSEDKNNDQTTKDNDFQSGGFWLTSIAGGRLRMWQIGIVTNISGGYSQYYLSLQLVYSADMYNTSDQVFIPGEQFIGYKDWYSLQDLLAKTIPFSSLKSVSEYQPKKQEELPLPDGNHCRVTWYNQLRRYGLGVVKNNYKVMIHASEIKAEFPALDNGQIVKFERTRRGPKGIELVGVSEI